MEVYFYLDRAAPELEPYVTPETMRLGCTPIVNLFERRAEPIKLTHAEPEYPVIPDARQRREIEVYSVDRVTTSSDRGETIEFAPLYSCPRGRGSERRPTLLAEPPAGVARPVGQAGAGEPTCSCRWWTSISARSSRPTAR